MDKTPAYCSVCGTKLQMVETNVRYNRHTGDLEPEHELRCPHLREPGILRAGNGHDCYWLNRDGEAIPQLWR